MQSLLRFLIISTLRDKFFVGIIGLLVFTLLISMFFGSTALEEPIEMTISYFAGSSRFIIIFGAIIFISSHIHRLIQHKEFDFIMSKPISREKIIFSYFIGISIINLFLVLSHFLMMIILKVKFKGLLIWSISLFCELSLASFFALMASIIFNSYIISVLASICFYITSRLMGLFLMANKFDYVFTDLASLLLLIPQKILFLLSYLVPRIDLFTETKWLIYYNDIAMDRFELVLIQTIIYIPLMLFVSFYDIKKKTF